MRQFIKTKIREFLNENKLEDLKNSKVEISIRKDEMAGVTYINFKLGNINANIEFFGEPMGIEGIPNWAKREYYLSNFWRTQGLDEKDIHKGEGIILFQKILENAKKNKIDIITLKRAEYSGDALKKYYEKIGFVNVGELEPSGMYLDLRGDEAFNKVNQLVDVLVNK